MLINRVWVFERSLLSCLASCLSLAILLLVGAAGAQAPASAPAAYGPLIDQAFMEYEARNFPEARALFSQAHALYPNARVLRSLGMVEFELRQYAVSAALLEQALASTVQPLSPQLHDGTLRLLARARGFVARLRLTVEPASAQVTVDGAAAKFEAQGELILEVGDHTLEFRAPSFLPERRFLQVKGGDEHRWHVVLTPEASVAPVPTTFRPASYEPNASALETAQTRRPILFVVPRLTLVLPGKGTTHYKAECSPSDCPASDTPEQENFSRGVAPLLGVDVMFAPLAVLRVGLGLHVQLNNVTEAYESKSRWEAGRIYWLPVSAEYRVGLNQHLAMPLRMMAGMTLMQAGRDLERAGETNRDFCKEVSKDGVNCATSGPPGVGAMVGAGPGLSFSAGTIALRADLLLGYSYIREYKMERRVSEGSRTDKTTATGFIAALGLGIEI